MPQTYEWYDQFRESLQGTDLYSEFGELMGSIGLPALARRADYSKRCSCTTLYGEPDTGCSICGGTGFLYEDIPVLVYSFQSGVVRNELYRQMDERKRAYLFAPARLKEIDQILFVQLTQDGKVIWPIVVTERYGIKRFEEKRGDDKGRAVFYQLEIADLIQGDIVEA